MAHFPVLDVDRPRPVPVGRAGLLPGLAACLMVVAGLWAQPAAGQEGTITGVVQEESSLMPISGAEVRVVGTQRATTTNLQGRFVLTGLAGTEATLRVSALGYRAVERTVAVGAANAIFTLAASALELDAIVVTGTAGATAKRSIGNVVSQVRAAETAELAPVASVQSLINARAPGVIITPGTGMVGSGSQIRIRGSNSFSLSNEPLLYVDGVRVDNAQATGHAVQAFGSGVISRINDFNPDDIESIEIIKGPAAGTLYGTEASNGVIHIITKRGAQGQARWDLVMRQGANWFADAEGRVPTNYWRNPDTGQVESLNLFTSEAARGTPLFRTGQVRNYSLSVSGGTADMSYYLAGDWDLEEGAEWDNQLNRASGRANLTVTPSDDIDITGSIGYVQGRYDLSCEAGCGGVTWAAYFSTPAHAQGDDRRRGARSFAPEYYLEAIERFQVLDRFTGSLQFNHRPTSWFTHRLTAGLDRVTEDNQTIVEKSALYLEWVPTGRGGKTVSLRDVNYNTLDYNGTFSFPLNPTVTSNTSLGAQYYRRLSKFVTADGADFATPGLRVINAAAETFGFENYFENATVGVFAQQQFDFDNRIFLTAALRADDNSAFGEDFSLVYYPKASATWVISEEPFFDVGVISGLRLRAAYGQAGRQPGAFDALRTYSPVAGPDDVSTVTPNSVGNPALGPERGSEIEFGFDAGFLDDRLGLDFTYYNQRTRDVILLRPVAPSTGFSGSRFINIGEVENRGFEAMLTATPVSTPSFRWEATFSLAQNDNEVLRISDEEDRIVVSSAFGVEHRVGYPLGSWFHRRVVSAEFDQDGQVVTASMLCDDGQGGTTACYSGNTAVAPGVFLGRSEPRHEGAISNTLSIGSRFRLYGLLDFKTGFSKWDHVTRVRCALFDVCRQNVEPLEFTDSDPAALATYQTGAVFGDEYIRDSGFLKLRELSGSYLLPERWAQRFGASRASFTLTGRNLATWSDWTGIEPEARFLSGARGGFGPLEQNHLPQLTSLTASMRVSF
ncbi:MAG TPA: SusC/RagA family TonB-linked outer membrane protein [Longimicrobiales bacterium]|nr:SusC/RagA family TonB-linked outer membrane protein [Longimicrobiales bacterium]